MVFLNEFELPEVNVFRGKIPSKMEWMVEVNGEPLPLRLDLRNHSPDGFAWGYLGSGPAQLALAILAYEYGAITAGKYYQQFKEQVIARLNGDEEFILTSLQIEEAMERITGNDEWL